MAEDGVQRFLVVVLAVEQQAFAAVAVAEEARGIHEAHRAGQAGDDVSGAARLRAIREAQAVAGAFIERIAGAKGVHGVHLQFHIFKDGGGAPAEGTAMFAQPAAKTQTRQKAHGGAGERSGGPDRAEQRLPVHRAQDGQGARAGGGRDERAQRRIRARESLRKDPRDGQQRRQQRTMDGDPVAPRGAAGARYCAARSAPSGRGKGRRRRGQHSTANIRGKRKRKSLKGTWFLPSDTFCSGVVQRVYFPATSSM